LAIGVGLHTGEWDKSRSIGEGPVAAAAARIAALAQPGEVLVSRTVVDLVGETAFAFTARGTHDLTAGENAQPLFAAR
jgi:class 3 adenylate cyclase